MENNDEHFHEMWAAEEIDSMGFIIDAEGGVIKIVNPRDNEVIAEGESFVEILDFLKIPGFLGSI